MRDFFETIHTELLAGRRVFACFVAANRKGSPGTPAARMLLLESGKRVGTIGGGIMEQRILERAKNLLAGDETLDPERQLLAHRKTNAEAMSGLFCGGSQTNVSLVFEASAANCQLLQSVVERCDLGGVLVFNESGMTLEASMSLEGANQMEELASGWRYLLNLVNQRRIAIFGGGHCGCALGEQMLRLGYAVSLIEPRKDVSTLEGVPSSITIYNSEFKDAVAQLSFSGITHAVIMTHSFPTDVDALLAALSVDFMTVGVMGSAPKIKRIRSSLADSGVSDSDISRVRAPVGFSIDSDTPEEIAVSIAAQILLERQQV